MVGGDEKHGFEISVGIVGAGEIVVGMHLPTLKATDGVSVTWLADLDGAKARRVGRAFRVDGLAAPRDPSLLPAADVVLLAIPFGARDPYYAALSARGSGIYVEKPFARTVAYHQTITAMFPEYQLGVGFQRRSWAPITTLREIVAHRLFGALRRVTLGFGGPGIVARSSYMSDIRLTGGGILFENGVHWLDVAAFVADAVAARVHHGRMIESEGFDLHTEASIELTTGSGDQVELEVTVSVLADTLGRMDFAFEYATVSCSFESPTLEVRPTTAKRVYYLVPARRAPETAYQTLHAHWSQYLRGLRARRVNDTSACRSLLTTRLLEDLYALPTRSAVHG